MNDNIEEDAPVLINFIENWCKHFPYDKERIVSIFVNITAGKTIENEKITVPKISLSDSDDLLMKINLNTASFKQLMSFSKMTIKTANKIIDDRNRGIFVTNENVKKYIELAFWFCYNIFLWKLKVYSLFKDKPSLNLKLICTKMPSPRRYGAN